MESAIPATWLPPDDRPSGTMSTVSAVEYLELLARDAAPVEYEGPLVAARASGADAATLAGLERARALALQVRSVLESRRRRETELSALFETAGDLATLNDVDAVLEAIVHRSRQMLHSDVAYLSLMDEAAGVTYMRVTDGCSSTIFRRVQLPLGAGLGGLVAQTATPYATAAYFEDERFEHTVAIDAAVADEGLVSIVGVPLLLGRKVIGVLYAANRNERPFTRADIALLTSFAAHAAVALDNARLLSETQSALRDLRVASEMLRTRTESVERASDAHDRFFALVLQGGDLTTVAHELAELLGGEALVVDARGAVLGSTEPRGTAPAAEADVLQRVARTSRTRMGDGVCAAPVVAGTEYLGAVVLRRTEPLDEADRRILERAGLVTALLLLFRRSVAAAEERLRGEFLEDVLLDRATSDLHERARLAGADLDASHAVVVAEVTGERGVLAQAAAFLAGGRGGLSTVHQGRLVLVLPDVDPHTAAVGVREELKRLVGRPLTIGFAGPVTGEDGLRAAHAEAARCLEALLALGRTGQVGGARELGFVGLLLGDRRDVPGYVCSVIGPVLDYDEQRGTALLRTLQEYFAHGATLAPTAAALHVHTNTVTQRLERVTQLLGEGWTTPERRLEVQLALTLHGLVRS